MRGGPIDSARFGSLESASQFSAKLWDALSKWGGLRKLHPRILPWNGMRFPNRRPKGNRIPL